ncbi:acyl-CoA N-acyltransferase [Gymnopus androsaceus JB14]|uniref:histone acetyltransferase n=1 Tax=Gymnopus androsaceus JB14 TaxID=1447944 RepID=A0A6A4ILC2_9AGAR|nr:acyl-CoA N-acyltransferase [Gymnopus androsaceus JB14]
MSPSMPANNGPPTISVGCKVYTSAPRLAEILSMRDEPVNPYAHCKGVKEEDIESRTFEETLEFFVHWDQFNKRLDEWVSGTRILLNRDLEWPRPKAPAVKKGPNATRPPSNLLKTATPNAVFGTSPLLLPTLIDPKHIPCFLLSPAPPLTNTGPDSQEAPPLSAFSKEQEIEKLRTSGSLTQSVSEIARIKNLNRLQIGKYEVETWCLSPYANLPSHIFGILLVHRLRCNLLHPPGDEIYRHEDISFYEIDGKRQLGWCRNLSLLSKCFLDQLVFFAFNVIRDSAGCHIIGYFSKEKERRIKKEGKLGSPEKPLNDLAYWSEVIVELLMEWDGHIAQRTSITHADVMNICITIQLFKHYKGQHLIVLDSAVIERHEKLRKKNRRRIPRESSMVHHGPIAVWVVNLGKRTL